jgi:hypothetical protein
MQNAKPTSETKLTLITINGITKLVTLPIYSDGHVRLTFDDITRIWGVKPGCCLAIG